jgi:hypothetical protein
MCTLIDFRKPEVLKGSLALGISGVPVAAHRTQSELFAEQNCIVKLGIPLCDSLAGFVCPKSTGSSVSMSQLPFNPRLI